MKYDVIIAGAGPSGIFTALELIRGNKDKKILLIEKGNSITKRHCPKEELKKCINCKPCDIMRGFGGAGAFSDGKYNFSTSFGGWLNDYIDDQEVLKLIDYVDEINMQLFNEVLPNGKQPKVFTSKNSKWKNECLKYDMHLLDGSVRHLGTENNLIILQRMYENLKDNVDFIFEKKVEEINQDGDTWISVLNDTIIKSKYLVAAPGRSGAQWFSEECKDLGLKLTNNQVDIGVRVEVPNKVIEHITDEIYELKVKYRSNGYEDIIRTFCMNPGGHVVTENTDGIITVNGHSFDNPKLRSDNTNFALLVSNTFTEPFNEPYKYGKSIASFSNMLGGGVIVQRFGDLIRNRRTDQKRLNKSFIKPTLNATPGDLSLVLPKRHLDNIIEMIYQLNNICPGIANDDILLYGVEVKFYSSRIELNNQLETSLNNLYAIGDGAGITRSLSQSAASGIVVARSIINKI